MYQSFIVIKTNIWSCLSLNVENNVETCQDRWLNKLCLVLNMLQFHENTN